MRRPSRNLGHVALLSAVLLVGAACSSGAGDGAAPSTSVEAGLVYVALGDSWPEGAHCNGCQTFPETHADALAELLGQPVTLRNLSGGAQPYFESPGGGGSTGLLEALKADEAFREEVASGDIIVISTGPNDGDGGEPIAKGPCSAEEPSCVSGLDERWHRDFDQILTEIEGLRAGRPTAIRLVNAANAFNDPSFSDAVLREWEAYFEALTDAMCDAAKAHDVVCVDVRPVLNGPGFEQPVNDSSQASMDAVAEMLVETGAVELGGS